MHMPITQSSIISHYAVCVCFCSLNLLSLLEGIFILFFYQQLAAKHTVCNKPLRDKWYIYPISISLFFYRLRTSGTSCTLGNIISSSVYSLSFRKRPFNSNVTWAGVTGHLITYSTLRGQEKKNKVENKKYRTMNRSKVC